MMDAIQLSPYIGHTIEVVQHIDRYTIVAVKLVKVQLYTVVELVTMHVYIVYSGRNMCLRQALLKGLSVIGLKHENFM